MFSYQDSQGLSSSPATPLRGPGQYRGPGPGGSLTTSNLTTRANIICHLLNHLLSILLLPLLKLQVLLMILSLALISFLFPWSEHMLLLKVMWHSEYKFGSGGRLAGPESQLCCYRQRNQVPHPTPGSRTQEGGGTGCTMSGCPED